MAILDIGGILIAVIAALGAWAAARSAARADAVQKKAVAKIEADKKINSDKIDAERGAYERARAFDVETIGRQENELRSLREEVKLLRQENKELRDRVIQLERRITNGPDDQK